VKRQIDASLRHVASVLLRHERAIQRKFRSALAGLGFHREEIDALADVSPAAAAASWDRVTTGGRKLALMNMDRERIVQGLAVWEHAVDPFYARSGVPDAHWHRRLVQCAVMLALNDVFDRIRTQEDGLLHALLDTEAGATGPEAFRQAAAEAVRVHFGAARCIVRRPPEKRTALSGVCAFTVNRRTAGCLLDSSWTDGVGSVWSAPAGEALLQLAFDGKRSLWAREAELMGVAGERIRVALERFEREELQRTIFVRMLDSEEQERLRISRELHDDAAQSLAVVRLQLEMMETGSNGWSEVRNTLAEMRELTERTILSVRRLISDLSPAVLQQLGLSAAARQLANRLRADSNMRVRVQIGTLPDLPQRVSLALYRILQEAFSNIARHSQAKNVTLALNSSDMWVRLSIEDDGIGFDPDEALHRVKCYGLAGIRLRGLLVGGVVSVRSTGGKALTSGKRPKGTHLTVQVPLTGEPPSTTKP
jgi:signal transduction histidine kinase